jgi:hypothetical protein
VLGSLATCHEARAYGSQLSSYSHHPAPSTPEVKKGSRPDDVPLGQIKTILNGSRLGMGIAQLDGMMHLHAMPRGSETLRVLSLRGSGHLPLVFLLRAAGFHCMAHTS